MDQLSEYGVAGQSIGHGKRTGTITLITPAPSASVTDQAIQQLLQREISSNAAFPQPSPNTLYFIFVPPGTIVISAGEPQWKHQAEILQSAVDFQAQGGKLVLEMGPEPSHAFGSDVTAAPPSLTL